MGSVTSFRPERRGGMGGDLLFSGIPWAVFVIVVAESLVSLGSSAFDINAALNLVLFKV